MASLEIKTARGEVRKVELTDTSYQLGRDPACKLSFPEDGGLSRQHLAVSRQGDSWVVADLNSRNGTFGVLAIALTVLIKVACLAQFSGSTGFAVLIAAHALSRAVIAYPLLAFSPVRPDGLGVQAGKPTDNDVWLAIGLGVAIALLLLLGKGFFVAILAPAAAAAAGVFSARWIARRIGGYTGDTLGAVQQKTETVFLVVAALFIPH